MTPPEPTDEELERIYYSGLVLNGRENRTTVAAHNTGKRALFAAGERHMLEMCIRAVSVDEPTRAQVILESLRDAPAGEARVCHHPVGSGECGCTDWFPAPICGHPQNPSADTEKTGEPPAKPEAAGEEPAIIQLLREASAAQGDSPDKHTVCALSYRHARELLAWLDRPAPAAPLCRRCGGKREIYGGDTAQLGSGKMIPCPGCTAPAAKEAGEPVAASVLWVIDELDAGKGIAVGGIEATPAGRKELLQHLRRALCKPSSFAWCADCHRVTPSQGNDFCAWCGLHKPSKQDDSFEDACRVLNMDEAELDAETRLAGEDPKRLTKWTEANQRWIKLIAAATEERDRLRARVGELEKAAAKG